LTLTNEHISQRLTEKFGEALSFDEPHGMLTVTAPAEQNLKLLQFLFDDEQLRFQFLTDLTGIHYPERAEEELCVVYQLHNLVDNRRMRVKVYVPVSKPDVFTATKLFPGASWMERETYDFYGINFVGHPDLRRILNADEMDYFPMRKEYALEDPQRTDKDDDMFGR
jgi:NADH-quinone oxidoreductase subunit C